MSTDVCESNLASELQVQGIFKINTTWSISMMRQIQELCLCAVENTVFTATSIFDVGNLRLLSCLIVLINFTISRILLCSIIDVIALVEN